MPTLPDSTAKVTDITPCGDGKVCITLELVVDAHRLVEISGQMLSVAVKGTSARKPK
jgi:hypothetical protein